MRINCYPKKDIFAVRLILEEGLVNAVKHGNGDDPAKLVTLRFCVNDDFVAMDIEDQGSGFDPNRVADPLAPENLEKTSGRGLLLMRAHSTCMRYSESGNRVSLIRFRSGSPSSDRQP
jgi:serine/threonine-protein kinase RsbW